MILRSIIYLSSYFLTVSADIFPFHDSDQYQNGSFGNFPAQTFVSDSDVVVSVANVLLNPQAGVSPESYITWAPIGPDIPTTGPQLLDAETLSLVYQAPLFGHDNFGLTVQTCNETDYLVWWSGERLQNRAAGQWHVLNQEYESVWNISAIGLDFADAHELFLTPDCKAVITVFEPRQHDLTNLGMGEDEWIMESYLQEIDPVTNTLLFQWQASDHVNINDTFWTLDIRGHPANTEEESWDFFHINSVEKDYLGNYLISSRHMSSLYYINGKTGAIMWTLGGRKNDFEDLSLGRATDIGFQHHARWTSANLDSIALFDDRNCRFIYADDPVSRGIVLQLDYAAMTVELLNEFRATSGIEAFRMGGMHYLDNGNAILGYGNEPGFTEFSPDGTVLWDVRFGPLGRDRDTADNYRSMKVNWTGSPTWAPKIAAGSFVNSPSWSPEQFQNLTSPNSTAYFSWNGATKLNKWIVLASNKSPNLTTMADFWCELPKVGFETSVQIGNAARYVRAVAIGADNKALTASLVLDMQDGGLVEAEWSSVTFDTRGNGPLDLDIEDNQSDDWNVRYSALSAELKNLQASSRKILILVMSACLIVVSILVVALFRHRRTGRKTTIAWKRHRACQVAESEHHDHGSELTSSKDDDMFSLEDQISGEHLPLYDAERR